MMTALKAIYLHNTDDCLTTLLVTLAKKQANMGYLASTFCKKWPPRPSEKCTLVNEYRVLKTTSIALHRTVLKALTLSDQALIT